MPILSDRELQQFAEIIGTMGGECLEVNQETRTFVFSFEDQEKMLTLISEIKSDKNLSRVVRINSKIVDGQNILTIDPS